MKVFGSIAGAALLIAAPAPALAWGNSGHRIVGQAAMRALPAELPAFLRTPQAIAAVGELSRSPDQDKGAGKVHDADRSPAHFVDVDDDGRVLGGPSLTQLPATRADYETALRAVGQDSWKAGYLPYAIIDRYQQLAMDFAYWRADAAGEANSRWRAHRAWLAADRRRREARILQTLGELSHFTGDGSQPLHVTLHFNGWGDYANPQGFTTAPVHAPFESDIVSQQVHPAAVAAAMTPVRVDGRAIETQVAAYLGATNAQVIPLYQLERAGGLAPGDVRGTAFATKWLAVGASELRDLVVGAWRASLSMKVGWKPVPLADVLAGRVDPYGPLSGVD
jgi:hypothetical protein